MKTEISRGINHFEYRATVKSRRLGVHDSSSFIVGNVVILRQHLLYFLNRI